MGESAAELPAFEGWEVVEKLGEGGMCAVYRVRDPLGAEPERAVKVLTDANPSSAERFAEEARLLQEIDHPNVVKVHELHAESRPPWIVMDLLSGHDLEESREALGPMDPERAARLFALLANGLAVVHDLGVRHRDLKPANIIVSEDGVPRLIDFGIARKTTRAHVTQEGFVVGTASYLPPEIWVEDDARAIQDTALADVYALGQCLCEVLTGMPVHSRVGGGPSLLVSIMKDKLDRPHLDPHEWRTQVPEALAAIVRRATAREPEDRTPTAHTLEAELKGWLEQRRAGAQAPVSQLSPRQLPPPPTTGEQGQPSGPKPETTAIPLASAGTAAAASAATGTLLVGALVLAALVGLVLLWVARPRPQPADGAWTASADKTVARAREALSRCGGAETQGDLTLRGSVRNGRAARVRVLDSTLADRAVGPCVTTVLEGLDWPKASTPVTVEMTVHFD